MNIFIIVFIITSTSILCGNWNPQEYHDSNEGQFKHAIKELEKLELTGTESILDIGSGDGRVSQYIASTCVPQGMVLGIDSSEAMINLAHTSKQSSNINYAFGDIATYHSLEQYDVIISFWNLHWVAAYDKALINIAPLLNQAARHCYATW